MIYVTWLDVATTRPANLNGGLRLGRKIGLAHVNTGLSFDVRSSSAQGDFRSVPMLVDHALLQQSVDKKGCYSLGFDSRALVLIQDFHAYKGVKFTAF